jgi:2-C-methyl-D-erythritol 2,4-cyclodiphosphate synthase
MRVGWGFDAPRFGGDWPTLLAGVVVDPDRGVEGTSAADVLAHAVADAVLGACALGDLGEHFPSSDSQWEGADSMAMLTEVAAMAAGAGFVVSSIDATVVAQRVRVAPHRDAIRDRVARTLRIDRSAVSVKATTTDGMGFLGRDEGIAAFAVVVVRPT